MTNRKNKKLIPAILFALYLALLCWIILFKMSFSLDELGRYKRIGLIPFELYAKYGFTADEFFGNILVFIPFGLYMKMLSVKNLPALCWALSVSLIFEICQYCMVIGSSDVTDLLTNTFGAFIGITLYYLAKKLFKSKSKTVGVINVFASVITATFAVMIILMLAFDIKIEF